MGGIIKGIGKAVGGIVKGIGKVVKQIAPIIMVAAAVYFGGWALYGMSAGMGATAGIAEGAAALGLGAGGGAATTFGLGATAPVAEGVALAAPAAAEFGTAVAPSITAGAGAAASGAANTGIIAPMLEGTYDFASASVNIVGRSATATSGAQLGMEAFFADAGGISPFIKAPASTIAEGGNGWFETAVNWIEKHPKTAELGARAVSGVTQGITNYQKEKEVARRTSLWGTDGLGNTAQTVQPEQVRPATIPQGNYVASSYDTGKSGVLEGMMKRQQDRHQKLRMTQNTTEVT